LPPGDEGVRVTVDLMTRKAVGPEGSQHPGIRAFAVRAVDGTRDRDDYAQAVAIFYAVKAQVRFMGEESETVQTPWLTLQLGAGDCDCQTTLLIALLRSIGIPARIETIATDSSGAFVHVYALAGIRQGPRVVKWLPLDPTVPTAKPGWEAPHPTRRHYWGDDSLGVTDERKNTMGYSTQPTLGMSFFKRLSEIGKVAVSAVKGYAEGGPAGAIAQGAKTAGKETLKNIAARNARHAAMAQQQQLQATGLAGYHDPHRNYYDRHRRHHEDARDAYFARHRYMGDAMGDPGFLQNLQNLTPAEKAIGAAATLGLLIAVVK
jgi:hypothetical protein